MNIKILKKVQPKLAAPRIIEEEVKGGSKL
jgi:hypothetical protein